MIGTYRWNLITGLIGFLGTLAISMPRNIPKTALVQSGYSFALLFVFTYIIRWVLGMVIHSTAAAEPLPEESLEPEQEQELAHKGQSIDLATPDDQAYPDVPQPEEEEAFVPLAPPKLSTKLEQDPERLAKALRQMSEE